MRTHKHHTFISSMGINAMGNFLRKWKSGTAINQNVGNQYTDPKKQMSAPLVSRFFRKYKFFQKADHFKSH